MSKHSHTLAIFEAEQAVKIYLCQWYWCFAISDLRRRFVIDVLRLTNFAINSWLRITDNDKATQSKVTRGKSSVKDKIESRFTSSVSARLQINLPTSRWGWVCQSGYYNCPFEHILLFLLQGVSVAIDWGPTADRLLDCISGLAYECREYDGNTSRGRNESFDGGWSKIGQRKKLLGDSC